MRRIFKLWVRRIWELKPTYLKAQDMTEPKHTPGEWIRAPHHTSGTPIISDTRFSNKGASNICTIAGPNKQISQEEHEANVHLVRAGGDMLDALREASLELAHGPTLNKVVRAIGKATGDL